MEETFVIARCVRCNRLLLSKTGVKTKTCPYCNTRFGLNRVSVVARAESAQEAKQMLAELKKRQVQDKGRLATLDSELDWLP